VAMEVYQGVVEVVGAVLQVLHHQLLAVLEEEVK